MATIDRLFAIIGMPRSGTTWLHQRLCRHSRMVRALGQIKEIHYFDHVHAGDISLLPSDESRVAGRFDFLRAQAEARLARIDQDLASADGKRKVRLERQRRDIRHYIYEFASSDQWYADLFADGPGDWCLDSTPAYYRLPEKGLRHLLSVAEQSRFLLLLRDPYERTLSGIRQRIARQGLDWNAWSENERLVFARLVLDDGRAVEETRRLLDNVPPERLRIVWFDDIREKPEEVVAAALDFADLDFEPGCMAAAEKIPNPSPGYELSEQLRAVIHAETRQTVQGLRTIGLDVPAGWDRPIRPDRDTLATIPGTRQGRGMSLAISTGIAVQPEFDYRTLQLPLRVQDAPGMLSLGERRLIYGYLRNNFEDAGLVVDGGSFLGSSTVAAAEALRERGADAPTIHAYERGFLPGNGAIRQFRDVSYRMGESFVPILEDAVLPYEDLVQLHVGDLLEERWSGDPIEFCFIDVCKSAALNAHVGREFLPHILPGKILVNQDFFFDRLPWIKITMGYLADYFEWRGRVHSSSIYVCKKQVPQAVADYDPWTARDERCLEYHDRAVDLPFEDEGVDFLMALSRTYLVALLHRKEEALAMLDDTQARHADYIASKDNMRDARNARFRVERARRQIRNDAILRVS
ncbi:sulfotransferase [Parasphingopyxis marina]|uniref:Sulfotransferase n=1 Tax=Parasphingopyxis marina TaxID=2761622 RepID=A0A842HZD5_9SPHN|nr:sulfotransferase [Parasphingopyxis marina]MBC2777793.1 sulfotransferase [Parasphingopyxis marina]